MAKKLKLQQAPEEGESIFEKGIPLYYSGFCLTDNLNFAEFYLPILPKECRETKRFEFDDNKLQFQIGQHPKIMIDDEKKVVMFDNFFIDKSYFLYFSKKYPNANFYWLKSFINEPIIGLVGVLIGTKLVGLLKLKPERS